MDYRFDCKHHFICIELLNTRHTHTQTTNIRIGIGAHIRDLSKMKEKKRANEIEVEHCQPIDNIENTLLNSTINFHTVCNFLLRYDEGWTEREGMVEERESSKESTQEQRRSPGVFVCVCEQRRLDRNRKFIHQLANEVVTASIHII